MRQSEELPIQRHRVERSGCKLVRLWFGVLGDILDKAADVEFGEIGVASLVEAGRIAGSRICFNLLDQILCLAIKLRGLDLNIGVILVPTLDDLRHRGHSLAIGQTMEVLDRDRLSAGSGRRGGCRRRFSSCARTRAGCQNQGAGSENRS